MAGRRASGRHRRPPAWRRLLLRLRRSDRAARFAALQAEVTVLRATVARLRDELSATRAAAAVQAEQHAIALTAALTDTSAPGRLTWLSMEMPLVELAPAQLAADTPAATTDDDGLDLEDTGPIPVLLADLPEAALLDPKQDRDEEPQVAADVDRTEQQPARRSA